MTSPDKGTIPHIAKLQSLGVTLVVLGHSSPLQSAAANPGIVVWYRSLIYSFHMPLFFFISGYLFANSFLKKKHPYAKFMAGKAWRLLLPYVALSTIAFFIKNGLPDFAYRSISMDVETYITGLVYPSKNPIIYFWFLPTLFMIFAAAGMFICGLLLPVILVKMTRRLTFLRPVLGIAESGSFA